MEGPGSQTEALIPETSAFANVNEYDKDHPDGTTKKHPMLVEVEKQIKLAGPLAMNNFSMYCLSIVTSMFIGHLGTLELSSSSLAISIASISGYTIMLAFASGLETLCGQAFGAKKYPMLGIFLQAEYLVSLSLCIPIIVLWWNIEPLLVYLGQDEEISKLAGLFLRWMSPSIVVSAIQQALIIYLQMQSVVIPQLLSAVFTVILHVITCFILIKKLGFGFAGGAISLCASYFYNLLFLLAWISFNPKTFERTWLGISSEAFAAIPTYLKVAIPSAFMRSMEYYAYELMIPLTGLLPNAQFECSVLYIILSTSALTFMISIAIGAAVSTRVSNEIGAGRPFSAQNAFRVALFLALVYTSIMAIILTVFRKSWPLVFSDDPMVVDAVSKWLPLAGGVFLFDGVQAVCSGVARGSGWQRLGAWINLGSFYVIGIPVTLVLSFRLHWGAQGVWFGYCTGLLMQLTIYLTVVLRTNWPKMVEKSRKLVNAPVEPLLASAEQWH